MRQVVCMLFRTDLYHVTGRPLWDCVLKVGRDRLFLNRYATTRANARRAANRIAKRLGIRVQDDLKRKDL